MTTSGVTGLILAGGKSKRLGADKALLPWPSENSPTTLLHHVHAVLAPLCDEVIVVGNRADLMGFTVVPDISPVGSSLTGLVSGLQAASTPLVLAVACDMPFLNATIAAGAHRLRNRRVGRCRAGSPSRTGNTAHGLPAALPFRGCRYASSRRPKTLKIVRSTSRAEDSLWMRYNALTLTSPPRATLTHRRNLPQPAKERV